MKRAAWMTTICFVFVTSIALAQSVDGNWTTNLRTREPDRQIITLTLKSEANKVSGMIHAFRPIPIEGSMKGNVLDLKLRVPTATGSEILVSYTGILEGDEIKFIYHPETGRPSPPFGPNAREFIARRAK